MKETNWTRVTEVLLLWQGIVAVTGGVMTAGVVWVLRSKLPPQIPLFYSRPWGAEQLTEPAKLIWPIILVLSILLIGLIAAKSKIDQLLMMFVAGVGLMGEIIIVLGIVRIFFLIT